MHFYAFVKKIGACPCVRAHSSLWLQLGRSFYVLSVPSLGAHLRVSSYSSEQSKGRTTLQSTLVSCSRVQLGASLQGGHTMFLPLTVASLILASWELLQNLCASLSDMIVLKLLLLYRRIRDPFKLQSLFAALVLIFHNQAIKAIKDDRLSLSLTSPSYCRESGPSWSACLLFLYLC